MAFFGGLLAGEAGQAQAKRDDYQKELERQLTREGNTERKREFDITAGQQAAKDAPALEQAQRTRKFEAGLKDLPANWDRLTDDSKINILQRRLTAAQQHGDADVVSQTQAVINAIQTGTYKESQAALNKAKTELTQADVWHVKTEKPLEFAAKLAETRREVDRRLDVQYAIAGVNAGSRENVAATNAASRQQVAEYVTAGRLVGIDDTNLWRGAIAQLNQQGGVAKAYAAANPGAMPQVPTLNAPITINLGDYLAKLGIKPLPLSGGGVPPPPGAVSAPPKSNAPPKPVAAQAQVPDVAAIGGEVDQSLVSRFSEIAKSVPKAQRAALLQSSPAFKAASPGTQQAALRSVSALP